MSGNSKIEWTDATWNPASGCTKASPGCKNCYAERLAKRLPASHATGRPFSEVACHPERLAVPLHWRRPRRVFVCSMGDLFHEQVPFKFISEVMDIIEHAPQHTFQVLTKRPGRALAWSDHLRAIDDRFIIGGHPTFPRNVWLGCTAEDQQRADERIPLLLQCPAAVRFVSVEPMLGPVDLSEWVFCDECRGPHPCGPGAVMDLLSSAAGGRWFRECRCSRLDWVICGGESGPGARPMHPAWPRSLRDQCKAAGVPFLFKQWGEWSRDNTDADTICQVSTDGWSAAGSGPCGYGREHPDCVQMWRVGKRAAGRLLEGVTHDEYPEATR